MDRQTVRQMVKAKLYRQNHTKKHSHTHSQKEKKEKNIYIIAPKVHHLNFGMIRCLFRYSTDVGYIKLIVEINPLLLRLLGEISLSFLCSHSSWGSALDLAPPLRVGRLRASVLCSDRMGLKEQLIRGSGSLRPGGERGMECGASLRRQRQHDVAPA